MNRIFQSAISAAVLGAVLSSFAAPSAAAKVEVERPYVFTDESAVLCVPGAEGPLSAAVTLVTSDALAPAQAMSLNFQGGVATLPPLGEGIHIVRLGDDAGTELRFLAMEPPPPPAPGLVERRLPRTGRRLAAGEPFTILAMGDSVTDTGEFHELLACLLRRGFSHPGVSAVKRGHPGRSIDATLRHFDSDTEGIEPHLGLLMYGLNDQGAGMPLPDFLVTEEAIVETMTRRFGADTVTIASTPQLGGTWPDSPDSAFRTRSWGVAQERTAREHGRIHVDGFAALWPDRAENLRVAEQALAPLYPRSFFDRFSTLLETSGRGDGTHPNVLGHLRLAKAVYAALCLPDPTPDPLELNAASFWGQNGLESHLSLLNRGQNSVSATLSVFAPEDACLSSRLPADFSLAPGEVFSVDLTWCDTAHPQTDLLNAPARRALRDNDPVLIVGLQMGGSFRTRTVTAPVECDWNAFRPERMEVPAGTSTVTVRDPWKQRGKDISVPLPSDADVFRIPLFLDSTSFREDGVAHTVGPTVGELVGYRPATAIPAETTVDADLGEWAGRRFIPLGLPCQARQIRGPDDQRPRPEALFPNLAFASGATALHVAMRATGAGNGDWMTLFFDPRNPGAFGTPGSYFWASVFLREGGAVEVSRGETTPSGPGTTGRWRVSDDGMVEAEWDIPWEWLGLDGFPASGRLGFSAIYRQTASPHTRLAWVESYFEWTPLRYGELRLLPDAAAESAPQPLLLRVEP